MRENLERPLWISVVNVMEIYSGKDARRIKYQKLIDEFLSSFRIIELNENIAKRAGLIRGKHNKPFADAAIAATCLIYDLVLVTKNVRHFREIKGLGIIRPY